ncbi:MAG: carboxypeptidase-like regulatory domain-containing protein [Acidobacteriota bacterium]
MTGPRRGPRRAPRWQRGLGSCLAMLGCALWLTSGVVQTQSGGDGTVAGSGVPPDPAGPEGRRAVDLMARGGDEKTVDAAAVPVAPPAPLAGWSQFEIKKTAAEMAETQRVADIAVPPSRTHPSDVRLPPQQDVLRLATGIGYLQGADFGGDVSGAGKINGMQTDVNLFFTAGPIGLEARSGYASIYSPGGTFRGEGGDLYSDLRGIARGARVSWIKGERWNPTVSLYLHRSGSQSGPTALAYRDRFQLFPRVRLAGELTSDGAAFFQTQYLQPRLDLTAYYRYTHAPFAGRDKGISGGFRLGRGVAVSGAIRVSDAVNDASQWQLASIRLPLTRKASMTLERSWWTGSFDAGATNALTLQVSLGPVGFTQRFQWGRTDYRQRIVPFGFDRRQSQSSAYYTPGKWGTMNYQQSMQWFEDGTMQQWDEVNSTFQIGRRTSLQMVTAFPNIREASRLRARLRRQLSPALQIEAEYGRLSAFQMTPAPERETSRVMITIRKTWQVATPSRGGDIRGRTVDQAGNPVAGALVRLGPYSAITDAAGGYGFSRVPAGDFALTLDKDRLPVSYAWDEPARLVTVIGSSREDVQLQVIPLNTMSGRVYIDANGNGRFDDNEGVKGAVLSVNGSVTATTAAGTYAFYNQPPGRYTIRLDVPRLAKGLAPESPPARDVELTDQQPLAGVDFIVAMHDMPILMRELPR